MPLQFLGPQALLSAAVPLHPAASLCVSSHQDTSQQSQGSSTCMALPSWGPSRIKPAETWQKVSEVPGGRAWGRLVSPLHVASQGRFCPQRRGSCPGGRVPRTLLCLQLLTAVPVAGTVASLLDLLLHLIPMITPKGDILVLSHRTQD